MNAPPNSWEGERIVLGGILATPEYLPDVREILRPADFVREIHRALWKVILTVADGGGNPDLVAVMEAVQATARRGEGDATGLESVGGASYFSGLVMACASQELILPHARRVRDLSRRRSLQAAVAATIEELQDPTVTVDAAADLLERRVAGVRADDFTAGQDWTRLGTATERVVSDLQRGDHGWCISTGFQVVDEALDGGIREGELVVLAARPKMGKSALALQFAMFGARCGHGVGIVSVEMSLAQNARRILAAESRVSAGRIRAGRLDDDQARRVVHASEDVHTLPVYIDDRGGVSVGQIRSRVRRLRAVCPMLRLVVVDYLQLLAVEGRAENRAVAVGAMSRELKLLAKEEGLAVLCLAQLNRGVEGRAGNVPIASDLRESGAIEQDLDTLLMLWRPEVYEADDRTLAGVALLKVELAREGRAGVVATLAFDGATQRFTEAPATPAPSQPRHGDYY